MIIWSLVQDTDAGLSTSLHATGREAYESLIHNQGLDEATTAEAMTELNKGIHDFSRWFANYLDNESSSDRFDIERHELP